MAARTGLERKDKQAFVRWILLTLILASGFMTFVSGPAVLLIYLLPTLFVLMHGGRYLGRRNILIFFVTVLIITYVAEYLGVHTGKIFGEYYYNTANNGPLLGGVPPLVMLTYFSIAYSTFWLCRILLGKFGVVRGWAILGFSVLGGLIMSLCDLASDPVNSTINRVYIWTSGGVFFGVPYQNFLGWLGETFLLFLVVFIIFAYWRKAPKLKSLPSKTFQLEPIVLFAAPILPVIFRPLWQHQHTNVYAAMSLIALFGLGTVVVASMLRVLLSAQKADYQ